MYIIYNKLENSITFCEIKIISFHDHFKENFKYRKSYFSKKKFLESMVYLIHIKIKII